MRFGKWVEDLVFEVWKRWELFLSSSARILRKKKRNYICLGSPGLVLKWLTEFRISGCLVTF